jgi:hypothetical protein
LKRRFKRIASSREKKTRMMKAKRFKRQRAMAYLAGNLIVTIGNSSKEVKIKVTHPNKILIVLFSLKGNQQLKIKKSFK